MNIGNISFSEEEKAKVRDAHRSDTHGLLKDFHTNTLDELSDALINIQDESYWLGFARGLESASRTYEAQKENRNEDS